MYVPLWKARVHVYINKSRQIDEAEINDRAKSLHRPPRELYRMEITPLLVVHMLDSAMEFVTLAKVLKLFHFKCLTVSQILDITQSSEIIH